MLNIKIKNPKLKVFTEVIKKVVSPIDIKNPPIIGIICNGSIPQGVSTDISDIDICVCCNAPISRFTLNRINKIDIDLHYEDARWLHNVHPPYEPTALFMLAHAEILWERGNLLAHHIKLATKQFDTLAPTLSKWEQFLLKIDCSARLSRVIESSHQKNTLNFDFLFGGLLEKAIEASLKLNNRWYLDTGHGIRDLQKALPKIANKLVNIVNETDRARKCKMIKVYLSKVFDDTLPLEVWDSDFVIHIEE
jgi:hypothetical protein